MFPISPDWCWEKHGNAPLTSKPVPGNSSASLDNTSHLLEKQGEGLQSHETQAFLLVSASFFVAVCCWVVFTVARVSWGKVPWYNKITSVVLCEGRRFPHTLFFPHSSSVYPKALPGPPPHPAWSPSLPNEHWDQCTEAEEDIQQHCAATSAPSMTAQSLSQGSTMLLTLHPHLMR